MIMSVEEFQRILNRGLGRAILYLQQSDSAPYREVILNACIHNTAYDAQVEGTRARYMHDIIHLTGEVGFYRDAILNALLQPNENDWDVRHLLDQAVILHNLAMNTLAKSSMTPYFACMHQNLNTIYWSTWMELEVLLQ